MQRDTLINFFRDLSSSRDEFLVYDDGYRRRSYTYEHVSSAARGFAAKLATAGLRKDDKVVFWGENRPEWIACYWGCLLSGIIVVPIDYRSSADFVARWRALSTRASSCSADDIPELANTTDFGGTPLAVRRFRLARRRSDARRARSRATTSSRSSSRRARRPNPKAS